MKRFGRGHLARQNNDNNPPVLAIRIFHFVAVPSRFHPADFFELHVWARLLAFAASKYFLRCAQVYPASLAANASTKAPTMSR